MKQFSSDNSFLPIHEEDTQIQKYPQHNSNADIDYLLTYINFKQGQELNLIEQLNNQHKNASSFPNSQLYNYILENTSKGQEKQNLVSILDTGMRVVSMVKSFLLQRKPTSKSSTSNNQIQIIKQLFIPKQQTIQSNNKTTMKNRDKKNQYDQLKKARQDIETKILLQKSEDYEKKGEKIFNYMLTRSIYEQIKEKVQDPKYVPDGLNILENLQKSLVSLEFCVNKQIDWIELNQSEKIQLLDAIWGYVDQLSIFL